MKVRAGVMSARARLEKKTQLGLGLCEHASVCIPLVS